MTTPNSTISVVLSSVSERRIRSDRDMDYEFDSAAKGISVAIELCKRKILESVGLTLVDDAQSRRDVKKARNAGSSSSSPCDNDAADKENGHPNVNSAAPLTSASTSKGSVGAVEKGSFHPGDDVVDVSGMKVSELRTELRSRGLVATGLKRDLQQRLADAIEEDREERLRVDAAAQTRTERAKKSADEALAQAEVKAQTQAQGEPKDGRPAPLTDGKVLANSVVKAEKIDMKDIERELVGGRSGEDETMETTVETEKDASSVCENMPRSVTRGMGRTDEIEKNEGKKLAIQESREEVVKQVSEKLENPLVPPRAALDFPGVGTNTRKCIIENDVKTDMTAEESASKDRHKNKSEISGSLEDSETAAVVSIDESSVDKDTLVEVVATKSVEPPHEQEELIDDGAANTEEDNTQADESSSTITEHPSDSCVDTKCSSKSPKKKKIGGKIIKATTKLFSPGKKDKSPLRSCEKSPSKPDVQNSSEDSDMVPPIPSLTCSSTQVVDSFTNVKTVKADVSKKVQVPESYLQANSSSLSLKTPVFGSKPVFSKSTEAKRKAAEEARKKRLAELRGKSKPLELTESQKAKLANADHKLLSAVALSKNSQLMALQQSASSLSVVSVASSSSATSATSSKATGFDKQKAEMRRVLAAQMREKAAAAMAQKKDAGISQISPSEQTVAVVQQAAAIERHIKQHKPPEEKKGHKQALAKAKSPTKPVQQQPVEVLSPMDTYEISDRGSDSEDDESDSDDMVPKKRVPKWAQKENLIVALEKQFMEGPDRIDPDDIFPEIATCDLVMIFDKKKARYRKRTSSGNWAKDRVTAQEKLVYKRTMGFGK